MTARSSMRLTLGAAGSFSVTSLVVWLLGGLAAAQPMGPGPLGPGPGGPLPGLQRLDLSEAQRAELRTLMEEQRDGQRAAMEALQHAEQELMAAIVADAPDTARIQELKARIGAAQTAMLDARVDLQLRVAQILTLEQRARLQQMAAEMPRNRPRRGPMGPGR